MTNRAKDKDDDTDVKEAEPEGKAEDKPAEDGKEEGDNKDD